MSLMAWPRRFHLLESVPDDQRNEQQYRDQHDAVGRPLSRRLTIGVRSPSKQGFIELAHGTLLSPSAAAAAHGCWQMTFRTRIGNAPSGGPRDERAVKRPSRARRASSTRAESAAGPTSSASQTASLGSQSGGRPGTATGCGSRASNRRDRRVAAPVRTASSCRFAIRALPSPRWDSAGARYPAATVAQASQSARSSARMSSILADGSARSPCPFG